MLPTSLRIENGLFPEHWDVIQDEATEEESKSDVPMFGPNFPEQLDSELTGAEEWPPRKRATLNRIQRC